MRCPGDQALRGAWHGGCPACSSAARCRRASDAKHNHVHGLLTPDGPFNVANVSAVLETSETHRRCFEELDRCSVLVEPWWRIRRTLPMTLGSQLRQLLRLLIVSLRGHSRERGPAVPVRRSRARPGVIVFQRDRAGESPTIAINCRGGYAW